MNVIFQRFVLFNIYRIGILSLIICEIYQKLIEYLKSSSTDQSHFCEGLLLDSCANRPRVRRRAVYFILLTHHWLDFFQRSSSYESEEVIRFVEAQNYTCKNLVFYCIE